MNTWVYYLFLIELIFAAPIDKETPTILKNENINDGFGSYRYSFDTSNGISQQEDGALTDTNNPDSPIKVKGSYSYTGSDGMLYIVNYIADENGFQPFGAHLPKSKEHILPSFPSTPFPTYHTYAYTSTTDKTKSGGELDPGVLSLLTGFSASGK